MVLEAVYEQDFLDCSYGFRPGRSAHQALEVWWQGLLAMGGGWLLDVDIQKFLDTLDHSHLRRFLDQRVRDGVLRRAIDKWLKAGVLDVLAKRLGKYGLSLHPEKTRLGMFRPPCERLGRSKRPGSFDFLGFTHHWCRSFKGYWVVKRRTAKDRFRHALKEIGQWCRQHRHLPVAEHQRVLTWKLRGYSQYYGLTGNGKAVSKFFRQVVHVWQKWLSRRSQRSRMNWERFNRLLARYPLPAPVMVHSLYRRAVNP